ncbi:Disulphide bond corrector protein DsbC [Cnuella takakiae]|uniref:Disulphide bond corrector protein DsbC n=2 Tax=Cnuella takakiae TaxID=1302690 RepID=A0A1M5J986_9BACT|nr:Disulphide bond corrector protein DsbC [Cnuella takakiae]
MELKFAPQTPQHMKQFFLALFILVGIGASAQTASPVSWSYSSKKLAENLYEVYLTATIQPGWHLYAQAQPADAIAQPTTFNFTRNPLLQFDGKVREIGKLEKFHDAKLDVSANQYSGKVQFVQKVKVMGKAKTAVTGKLEFQTCDDEKCLPPKTVNFAVALK